MAADRSGRVRVRVGVRERMIAAFPFIPCGWGSELRLCLLDAFSSPAEREAALEAVHPFMKAISGGLYTVVPHPGHTANIYIQTGDEPPLLEDTLDRRALIIGRPPVRKPKILGLPSSESSARVASSSSNWSEFPVGDVVSLWFPSHSRDLLQQVFRELVDGQAISRFRLLVSCGGEGGGERAFERRVVECWNRLGYSSFLWKADACGEAGCADPVVPIGEEGPPHVPEMMSDEEVALWVLNRVCAKKLPALSRLRCDLKPLGDTPDPELPFLEGVCAFVIPWSRGGEATRTRPEDVRRFGDRISDLGYTYVRYEFPNQIPNAWSLFLFHPGLDLQTRLYCDLLVEISSLDYKGRPQILLLDAWGEIDLNYDARVWSARGFGPTEFGAVRHDGEDAFQAWCRMSGACALNPAAATIVCAVRKVMAVRCSGEDAAAGGELSREDVAWMYMTIWKSNRRSVQALGNPLRRSAFPPSAESERVLFKRPPRDRCKEISSYVSFLMARK